MADEAQTPEPSPADEMLAAREKVSVLAQDALVLTDDGPILDLDLFTRMLIQRAIRYRMMNREIMAAELSILREEQSVQKVQAENTKLEGPKRSEANQRLIALKAREKTILDQLWPLP